MASTIPPEELIYIGWLVCDMLSHIETHPYNPNLWSSDQLNPAFDHQRVANGIMRGLHNNLNDRTTPTGERYLIEKEDMSDGTIQVLVKPRWAMPLPQAPP